MGPGGIMNNLKPGAERHPSAELDDFISFDASDDGPVCRSEGSAVRSGGRMAPQSKLSKGSCCVAVKGI